MKLTKQQILDLRPCREGLEFAASCDFNAVKIWNTCERGDLLMWLLRRTRVLTRRQAVSISIAFSAHVLEKFESEYPDDKRPRAAIDAARKWLADPSDEHRATAAYATATATAYATATATDAADAADDDESSERKWQADKIRELIPCPFEL